MNKLSSIITQNIDNLHQKAGNNPKKFTNCTAIWNGWYVSIAVNVMIWN